MLSLQEASSLSSIFSPVHSHDWYSQLLPSFSSNYHIHLVHYLRVGDISQYAYAAFMAHPVISVVIQGSVDGWDGSAIARTAGVASFATTATAS